MAHLFLFRFILFCMNVTRSMVLETICMHYLSSVLRSYTMLLFAYFGSRRIRFVFSLHWWFVRLNLFYILLQDDNIEEFCNPKRERETMVTHHVPKHSLDDIPNSVWKKVDSLTSFDSLLYKHAVYRFMKEFIFLTKVSICNF